MENFKPQKEERVKKDSESKNSSPKQEQEQKPTGTEKPKDVDGFGLTKEEVDDLYSGNDNSDMYKNYKER
ncbi:MAG: hypothetical protein PHC89_00595 [Candidatus Pacebacteria bacterium]|nr:hypothetical protein [Candidatus Paceibacterota bacterium]